MHLKETCVVDEKFQDEDVYTFFEPELPSDNMSMAKSRAIDALKLSGERKSSLKIPASKSGSKSSHGGKTTQRPLPNTDKRTTTTLNHHGGGSGRRPSPEKISWNVLDLKGDNYFSCAVGRNRTKARFTFASSDEVVSFLKELAGASCSGSP